MGLKVIGAGGPRTGTASLKTALEILGVGKCYHMEELFNDPDQVNYWIEFFETRTTDFDTLFDGYQSTADFPGCLLYKELLAQYPDAKVILNIRDPEEWYNSAINTVYAATPQTISQKLNILKKMILSARFRKISKVFRLVAKYLWNGHYRGEFKNKEQSIEIYTKFNEEVRQFVPPGQLLEYRISDGWEPLCSFLEVPVPNQAFPYKNKRKEFKEQIAQMMNTGGKLQLK